MTDQVTQPSSARGGLPAALPLRPSIALMLMLAACLFAPSASAASPDLHAAGATGNGLFASGSGILDLALGTSSAPSMTVTGGTARLTLVDEVAEGSVRNPVDPSSNVNSLVGGTLKRHVHEVDLDAFTLSLAGITDDDARVLLLPFGADLDVDVDGRYAAQAVKAQVLERSHAMSRYGALDPWQYYEFGTGPALDLCWNGDSEVVGQGDFLVYFWGVSLAYSDAAQSASARTGHSLEANGGELGALGFVKDEHFRYAVLNVTGGLLQYAQSGGQVHLFAEQVATAPDAGVTFRGAEGTLQTTEGRLQVEGGVVQATGGTYRWSLQGGRMGVSVLQAPGVASGTNAIFAPMDGPLVPSNPVIYVVSAALLALALAGYAYPSLRGRRIASAGATWRERRADGYASMAAAAETAGHPRRAAFWMACALRVVPADPLRMVDLAILCAKAGQAGKALRLHEEAHGWLLDAGNGEQTAHNAYEAAKAAARTGRTASALDWLRMALESEPGLVGRIGREPAFATLRTEADYGSLTVGGR